MQIAAARLPCAVKLATSRRLKCVPGHVLPVDERVCGLTKLSRRIFVLFPALLCLTLNIQPES